MRTGTPARARPAPWPARLPRALPLSLSSTIVHKQSFFKSVPLYPLISVIKKLQILRRSQSQRARNWKERFKHGEHGEKGSALSSAIIGLVQEEERGLLKVQILMFENNGEDSELDYDKYGKEMLVLRPGTSTLQVLRVRVLLETLTALGTPQRRQQKLDLACANVERWAREAHGGANDPPAKQTLVVVCSGDWGQVAHKLSRRFGKTFACLNMANAYHFGGGYDYGTAAQEENMFRRTDCHFADALLGEGNRGQKGNYPEDAVHLLNGKHGRVYLDVKPRVCIRGPEEHLKPLGQMEASGDIGYQWLKDDQVFPFYELRAAAHDLRRGAQFSWEECRKRIDAQLDTLAEAGIKHVVLSAFGCGAFQNPSDKVAICYRQALEDRPADQFKVVAFGIFHGGVKKDNFGPFAKELSKLPYPKFAVSNHY